MKDQLIVKGARQHNLKNIDIALPRDSFIVLTGLSGSGKSSLAFDTIYAEGQRRYVESLSAYARQFLGQMDKPDVDYIEGLSPAISIDQKTTSRNPRSTVGTVTEIYDYLRLLFARVGHAHCPQCGKSISQQTIQQMTDAVMALEAGTKILVIAPIVRGKKGEHKSVFEQMRKEGFSRVRVDGEVRTLDEDIELQKTKKHDIDVVVDRLVVKEGIESRLADSMETAAKWGEGLVVVAEVNGPEHMYSQHFACPDCHISLPKIEPRMFSFNSPFGACPACAGIGSTMEVDEDMVIPDPNVSFADGCVVALSNNPNAWFMRQLEGLLVQNGYSLNNTFAELPKKLQHDIMHGTVEKVSFDYENMRGEVKTFHTEYEGILPMVKRRHSEASTDAMREEFEKFMSIKPCTTCHGARLKPEVLAITVGEKNIEQVTDMTIKEAVQFFDGLQLSKRELVIGEQILKEIKARLGFLNNVGLDYLTMSRAAGTLSGGEAQRIRLATQIGSGLVGVLYILDEPSIGLHQRDNAKLLETLKHLRDLGNTLLVVEHDEETMYAADQIIDIGPGAGEHGGEVVAQGTVEEIKQRENSMTGTYLSGRKFVPVPKKRRQLDGRYLTIRGARANNLKNIDVKIPLGVFTVVTGVSGSGKSTLINDILYNALAVKLNGARLKPSEHDSIEGLEEIDKVINIDQSPIGRTPRSNPATYTRLFDFIRELFASTNEAKLRGYKNGRFSFNVKGGRCEACKGDGMNKIEMNFLPDVYVPCDVCHGARYNRDTLEVHYKGKSIADVLDMTVSEACEFFKNLPKIYRKLEVLEDVGLGYIHLGQAATTLSGGEAQRVKLATELSRRSTGRTVYILDEPTTGLHIADVHKLLEVLQRLVDAGDSVIVIEHNLDVIKVADYIVDLGPEGGDKGGNLLAAGTPEEVSKISESYTGQYIKKILSTAKKNGWYK